MKIRNVSIIGYTESDYDGCSDNKKSTLGYIFQFTVGAISWRSRFQECIALSTTEAEYIVAKIRACMSDPCGTTGVIDQEKGRCRRLESFGACRPTGRIRSGWCPGLTLPAGSGFSPDAARNEPVEREGPCAPLQPLPSQVQGLQKRHGSQPC